MNLMVLMETMIDDGLVSRVMNKIGFFFFSIPLLGRRGGLVFYWRLDFRFKLLGLLQNFIHLKVEPGGESPSFLCSLV